jgi:hypothetical protein
VSAKILRRAASLMRERAAAATRVPWDGYADGTIFGLGANRVADKVPSWNVAHVASWHPAVALAVAKAMDDVAHAWEIADESADGYVYDADDNHWRFEETVDGGWLAVARAYLGESA